MFAALLQAPGIVRGRARPFLGHRTTRDAALLFGWCLLLFLYGVDTGTLYRTEALRAIIGRSALQGDWLIPTVYGEPFLTKPPGMYAAIAACGLPFGEVTTVSARLPSVIAATSVVFLFYFTLRRLLDARSALFASLLSPCVFPWLEKVPSAEIDMAQLALVAFALLFFHRASELEDRPERQRAFGWWLGSLLCVAAGFLTKWTAPAFFYLTVATFLGWTGRWRMLVGWRHLAALGIAVGVCAAWALVVNLRTNGALLETFLAEARQRFAPGRAGKPYPWLESLAYPFEVLGAHAPWSIFALGACRPAFRKRLSPALRRFVLLLHCWVWPSLLFWSLPAQHHVRYSLPITPALVMLGVIVLVDWANRQGDGRVRFVIPLILIGWAAVKIVYVEAVLPARTAQRHARETAQQLQRLVPEGETLYLCRMKDEGVMFYYGRPIRRSAVLDRPPTSRYAALLLAEWRVVQATRPDCQFIAQLTDQQGDPIIVVRFP
jgi:4-amino-4-deoxy-L-arabinose transferase-like glycosyltransferase